MSDFLWLHGLYPARLLYSWDSPGKNTGVGCYFLLQGILPTRGLNPDLPHCRQILYCLSRQGRELPESAHHLSYIKQAEEAIALFDGLQVWWWHCRPDVLLGLPWRRIYSPIVATIWPVGTEEMWAVVINCWILMISKGPRWSFGLLATSLLNRTSAYAEYPQVMGSFPPPKVPHLVSCCWVAKSCRTLCHPVNCSTPGFPALHFLPEFAQTLGISVG